MSDGAGDKVSLLGMTPDMLGERLAELGQPRFRAKQLLEWLYDKSATSFDAMSNLPAALRTRLENSFHIFESEVIHEAKSTDGTRKLLLRWADGATTECVLIPDAERATVCISTQVGCPVGCVFCASGLGGLERQLTAAQIVEQVMLVRRICAADQGKRLSNVVFMGLGEPLHNYDATLAAVKAINADWGPNIAARKITISTVGLPKRIKQLADERLQLTLAISLHAPNDTLRKTIIPWAEAIDIASLIEAARYYFERTGREVTVEYILLGGLNDQPDHARELATLSKRMRANINLIMYNPVDGLPYKRPTVDSATAFQALLRKHGANSHIRRSRGLDIDGACGQLRRRKGSA